MKFKISKKETNKFEYAILGIDLLLKYFYSKKKNKKKEEKSSNYKHNVL